MYLSSSLFSLSLSGLERQCVHVSPAFLCLDYLSVDLLKTINFHLCVCVCSSTPYRDNYIILYIQLIAKCSKAIHSHSKMW